MKVMETLICVASQDVQSTTGRSSSQQNQHLMQLLCSLQTNLVSWCHRNLSQCDDKELSLLVQSLVTRCESFLYSNLAKQLYLPGSTRGTFNPPASNVLIALPSTYIENGPSNIYLRVQVLL